MTTAKSHAQDFMMLIDLEEFYTLKRTEWNVKPMVLTIDGGPDENPKYEKVLQFNILRNTDLMGCLLPHKNAWKKCL